MLRHCVNNVYWTSALSHVRHAYDLLLSVINVGREIEGGHSGQVRRFMGVILEGEEIERGYARWPKATHRGRRPPAREASVPPAGTRRRAAERLELL